MTQNIWNPLKVETILDTVEQVIQKPLSSLCLKRNSYINRVFELELRETQERIIVKFYRPGRWIVSMIQAEHDFLSRLASQEIPVIPPLTIKGETLFDLQGIPWAVFPKKGGRALDEFDQEGWTQLGRLLGRLHNQGEKFSKATDRIQWLPQVATDQHLTMLEELQVVPDEILDRWRQVTDGFVDRAMQHFESVQTLLIHGDCHRSNLIHRLEEGIWLVDFDDMCVGPAVQDLWMFLPDRVDQCESEIRWFLNGYQFFREWHHAEFALIPWLQGMRQIHFAAWCALQKDDDHFEETFPEWGNTRYWNELIKELQSKTL